MVDQSLAADNSRTRSAQTKLMWGSHLASQAFEDCLIKLDGLCVVGRFFSCDVLLKLRDLINLVCVWESPVWVCLYTTSCYL